MRINQIGGQWVYCDAGPRNGMYRLSVNIYVTLEELDIIEQYGLEESIKVIRPE